MDLTDHNYILYSKRKIFTFSVKLAPPCHPQAIVSQQDSQIELQKASLTERVSLPGRNKGNGLLEQEKQRTLALQREELAYLNKLQSQHRQEQQRWEKERERHRQQVEATEARLQQREEECRKLEVQVQHAALKILSRFKWD